MDLLLRQATLEDYNFLYGVKKLTLKKYIEKIWGWDEAIQRKLFAEDFDTATHQVITYKGIDIGLLETYTEGCKLNIAELEILPDYQGQKIGTSILKKLMMESCQNNITVNIGCFKINTGAKRLYESLGFKLIEETQTHYILEY